MTTELITGKSGTPHISSDDMGTMQAGIIGYKNYVLADKNGNFPTVRLRDNNHVTIPVMALVVDGRYVRVTSNEDVMISSGVSGYKRNDILCLKYSRDASMIETISWTVVKGSQTTGTPSDPSISTARIIDGATNVWIPVARITINGITASQPVMLTTNLSPVGDSVTQVAELMWKVPYSNSKIILTKYGRTVTASGIIQLSSNRTGITNSPVNEKLPEGFIPKNGATIMFIGNNGQIFTISANSSNELSLTTTGAAPGYYFYAIGTWTV